MKKKNKDFNRSRVEEKRRKKGKISVEKRETTDENG